MCWAGRVGAFPHVRAPPPPPTHPYQPTHARVLSQPKGYSKLPLLMLVVQAVEVVVVWGGGRGDTAAREPRGRVSSWRAVLAGRQGALTVRGCMRATARPRTTARGLRRKILLGLGYFTVWFLITPT